MLNNRQICFSRRIFDGFNLHIGFAVVMRKYPWSIQRFFHIEIISLFKSIDLICPLDIMTHSWGLNCYIFILASFLMNGNISSQRIELESPIPVNFHLLRRKDGRLCLKGAIIISITIIQMLVRVRLISDNTVTLIIGCKDGLNIVREIKISLSISGKRSPIIIVGWLVHIGVSYERFFFYNYNWWQAARWFSIK